MFTANPANGRRDQIVISAAWGLGESVVSGTVTHRRRRRRGGHGPRALAPDRGQGSHDRLRGARHPGAAGAGRSAAASRYWTTRRRRSWPATEHGSRNISGRRRTSSGHGPATSSSSCSPGPSRRCLNRRPTPRIRWPVPYRNGLYFRASIVEQLPDPLSPLFADLIDGSVSRSLRRLMARRRRQERHPRGRRRAAHRQRLRLLLLPQLGPCWRMMGQSLAAMRGTGPRQGAHGGDRLAGILPPPLRAGVKDWSAKPVGEPAGRGTAGGCADLGGRRHRVLHGGAVHHSGCRDQRNLLPGLLRQVGPARRRSSRRDVPAGLRQRTHPGGEVAVRPRSLGPPGAGAGPGAPRYTGNGRWPSRSAPDPPSREWTRHSGGSGSRGSKPTSTGSAMRSITSTSSVRCRPMILPRCWRR